MVHKWACYKLFLKGSPTLVARGWGQGRHLCLWLLWVCRGSTERLDISRWSQRRLSWGRSSGSGLLQTITPSTSGMAMMAATCSCLWKPSHMSYRGVWPQCPWENLFSYTNQNSLLQNIQLWKRRGKTEKGEHRTVRLKLYKRTSHSTM